MRFATWNIYWLGDRSGDKIQRGAEDLELIARVLQNVAADGSGRPSRIRASGEGIP